MGVPHGGSSVTEIFADYVQRGGSGESTGFQALCKRHPEIADELRALERHWQQVNGVLDALGVSDSLVHGALSGAGDADAGVSDTRQSEQFASGVMQRLGERRAAFGKYELQDELARGGQGMILRIWDKDLRRQLAMKVALSREDRANDAPTPAVDSRTLGRFLEEAQVTGQLEHPGIVPVHELGLDAEGRVYFTMKLVKGENLGVVFEKAKTGEDGWTQTRALNAVLRVCEALSYAHSKGVIHRDLKPSNVMVGKFGEVYVMDWGLARVLGQADLKDVRIKPPTSMSTSINSERREFDTGTDSPLVTMDGDVVGTPSYMSPEQAEGRLDDIGTHSDVYAVGAMLYELLAGHAPYVPPGTLANNYAVWRWVLDGPPKGLHLSASGNLPGELVAITERAMERDLGRRFASMTALANDLQAFLEQRVVSAYETGAWAEARKWIQRNRPLASALAAALVLLVVGLITSLVFRSQAAERATDVLRLSSLVDVEGLRDEADRLWPAHPRHLDAYESWMVRARELVSELPAHRAKLSAVEAEVGSVSADVTDDLGRTTGGQWWFDQLTKLIGELETMESGLLAEGALTAPHGWSIPSRMERAREWQTKMAEGGAWRVRWERAVQAVRAHPSYEGFEMSIVYGLVPLAPDARSGLWEFWHVGTGEEPRRDEGGSLVVDEEVGLVFVLVPPPSVDIDDDRAEGDSAYAASEIDGPYLISKYEMTQGQWLRTTGTNPAGFRRSNRDFSLAHPVERVSWEEATAALQRTGLRLATEREWDHAARAGTDSPWWTGDSAETLLEQGAANCRDDEDGYESHAPVGTFAANRFGLHDVHGNVFEWAYDRLYEVEVQVDGETERQQVSIHTAPQDFDWSDTVVFANCLGGGFDSRPDQCDLSLRSNALLTHRAGDIGVRPVMPMR